MSKSREYEEDMKNFETLSSENQAQYQKEFSALADSTLDTTNTMVWTQ